MLSTIELKRFDAEVVGIGCAISIGGWAVLVGGLEVGGIKNVVGVE